MTWRKKRSLPRVIRGTAKTLPGLRHFYLAGQRVEMGGTVTQTAASGKNAVQLICARDRQ